MKKTVELMDDVANLLAGNDLPDEARATLEAVAEKLNRFERMEKMLDAFGDMLYVRDLKTGQFQYVNQSSKRVVFVAPDELVDCPSSSMTDRIHPDDLEGLASVAAQEMTPRGPFEKTSGEFLFRVLGDTGDMQWVRENWTIHRDEDGHAVYAVGHLEVVPSSIDNSEAPDTRDGETTALIASALAHDFNNLLGAIFGNLELISISLPENTTLRSYVDVAAIATRRAADLNKRLARLGRCRNDAEEPVCLKDLIDETVALIAPMIPPGVEIETRVPTESTLVTVDTLHIRRALMNLVKNAIESFDKSPGIVRLELRVEEASSKAVLTVGDNGSGIASDIVERIFDPFFTTKSHGHGLGLSVIRGILRQYGGLIEVQSALGEGTSFEVMLPLAESTESKAI